MRAICFFCIVGVLLSSLGCVESRQFVTLENRVAAMEMENNRQLSRQKKTVETYATQLESIKERLNGSQTIKREEYAELRYNMQTFRKDLQRLEGLIEEINHRFELYSQKDGEVIEKQLEHLDNAISKNYEKVIKLEKYMGFEPSTTEEADKKYVSSEKPGKNTEQESYDSAKKLFDDGDKENARIQFENFINKYPDSDNADNARFWIADSYYSEKWFEKAILEYQKVLEEYPGGNKLAAARLKQGYAFAELGEKANARLILKELLKKHPDSNEARYAQKKLKSLK